VFLDEIGEMNMTMQVKLLPCWQDRPSAGSVGTEEVQADIRIIAATNQDLEKLVATDVSGKDLFYRINVIPMHLPPLRERPRRHPGAGEHFLSKYSQPR